MLWSESATEDRSRLGLVLVLVLVLSSSVVDAVAKSDRFVNVNAKSFVTPKRVYCPPSRHLPPTPLIFNFRFSSLATRCRSSSAFMLLPVSTNVGYSV